MTINEQKQQLSFAYLHLVAARAGFTVDRPHADYESVDAVVGTAGEAHGRYVYQASPRLEVQLKATSENCLRERHLAFELDLKNYNDLRKNSFVPRILVVLLLPADEQRWVSQTEEELVARHCGYWISLRGREASPNKSSVTVHLPRDQQLSAESLRQLMLRIDQGGRP